MVALTVKQQRQKMKITIPADKWTQYLKIKAERAALEKREKELLTSFNIPEASPENIGQTFILTNGNGDEIGKVSYFNFPGATIPCGVRRRIS